MILYSRGEVVEDVVEEGLVDGNVLSETQANYRGVNIGDNEYIL